MSDFQIFQHMTCCLANMFQIVCQNIKNGRQTHGAIVCFIAYVVDILVWSVFLPDGNTRQSCSNELCTWDLL